RPRRRAPVVLQDGQDRQHGGDGPGVPPAPGQGQPLPRQGGRPGELAPVAGDQRQVAQRDGDAGLVGEGPVERQRRPVPGRGPPPGRGGPAPARRRRSGPPPAGRRGPPPPGPSPPPASPAPPPGAPAATRRATRPPPDAGRPPRGRPPAPSAGPGGGCRAPP